MNINFTQARKNNLPMADVEKDPLYLESIVVDGCSPLASQNYYDRYIAGGATMVCATIYPLAKPLPETISGIQEWYEKFRTDDRLLQIQKLEDIYTAKKEGKLGIMLAFQGCAHLQGDLDMIEVYYRLGIRQMMLCYNVKNALGDGCTEPGDGGLSVFGEKALKEMSRLGIIVDLSHTGHRTTMEAMDVMEKIGKPPIFSHGNVYGVHQNERNLRDDQIIRCAELGGVIGISGFPSFVGEKEKPSVDDFLDHVDYVVKLVGIDHVSLGIDYYWMQAGLMSQEDADDFFNQRIASGQWSAKSYNRPPYYYPDEISLPDKLPNIVPAMRKRGYSDEDIKKVIGGNYMRVAKQVLK